MQETAVAVRRLDGARRRPRLPAPLAEGDGSRQQIAAALATIGPPTG
jgi:hypothetical protein